MLMNLLRRSSIPSASTEARERAARRAATSTPSAEDASPERTPPRPQDLALSPLARSWAAGLPDGLSVEAVCAEYPRIANRLALCWRDPALTRQVFEQLLVDRRGGRRGFPPVVQAELDALRRHAAVRDDWDGIDGLEVKEVDPSDPWVVQSLSFDDR